MVKNVNQLKTGVILSYMQMALNIIIGLAYTPIMIRTLGQSEYGLYNTVSSTISMLSILSLGFNSSYIRYYAKYKRQNDQEAIAKLNGMFLLVFIVIGLIGLLCGLFLSFNLQLVFDTGLTDSEYETAKVLMLLLTANLALSFPFSVFGSIISSHEKFVFLKLLGMVRTVASPLITVPLLLLGYGSIALVIVMVATNIVVDLIYLYYVVINLKQKFIFKRFEKGLFRSLFVYTSFIAINLIVDQINWNIDKFLLGRFKGTVSVAVYSVGYALYSYYMTLSSSISSVFTPRVHAIISNTTDIKEQKQVLTELFTKVGRIQFLILALIATGLIFFGKQFIFFWAGDGYEDSFYVMILLVLSATIALIQNLGIEIQRAQNKHKFKSIIYLAMALINLVLSIFLCQLYGAIGSAIGTAISLLIANGLVMNIYYHRCCNINILSFWKSVLRLAIGLIIPVGFGIIMTLYVDLYSVWKLVLGIVIYTIVYAGSMWLVGMNKYEKQLIIKPLKRILKNDKNSK